MPPAIHGGSPDPRLLDFSTGVSPLPCPEELLAAVRDVDVSRYPHPTALPVREAIGTWHDLPASQIVVGAGSVELIWALARAFAGPGRRGLVVRPAFGEYEQALKAGGATVMTVEMAEPRFDFPSAQIEAALATDTIATAFICRPSNPCLTAGPAVELMSIARRWPATLFVVDEAYLPMFDGIEGVPLAPNVVVLRSFTKVFALPGLRLGYLLAEPPIAAVIQAALPPWNVSSPAQAAGVVAARLMPSHLLPIRAQITALRSALAERLASVTGRPDQAGGPFLLYRNEDAPTVVRKLRDQGVLVRHAASFGLPRHIRVGIRMDPDHERLGRAWRASQ